MEKDTITIILAIWGAIVSSIAIGWNLFRDLSERGRLRVSCYIGNIVGLEGADPNDYLVWNVTNIGRQPIMLTHIGGGFKKKYFAINPQQPLPRMLKPGEYVIEYIHNLNVLRKDLKFLSATDSIGKIYNVPRKQVRELKRKYARGEYAKKSQTS